MTRHVKIMVGWPDPGIEWFQVDPPLAPGEVEIDVSQSYPGLPIVDFDNWFTPDEVELAMHRLDRATRSLTSREL